MVAVLGARAEPTQPLVSVHPRPYRGASPKTPDVHAKAEVSPLSQAAREATVPVLAADRAPLLTTVPLLMLVVATAHFNRVGMAVAGTERIVSAYHVDPERMGLVYSAFLLVYTLAMLPGGWFIDRFGARSALMVLCFGSTVFVALTGAVGLLAEGPWALWIGLLIVRSLLGLLNAPLHPASARMVFERIPPESRAMANGLVTFAACVGIAATFYALGKLIDLFDWPIAFLISGVLTFLVAIVWTIGTRPAGVDASSSAGSRFALSALWPVLRRRGVICIALSYAAYGYFQYLFFYWIQYYFETMQHVDRGVSRGYNTLITIAMGIGMLGGGWLADRVPRSLSPRARVALVPVLGMIASGVVFELGLLASDARTTLASFTLSAGLLGLCEAGFWTTVVELGHPFGGTAAGLMNTGGNAGGTLSPYLTPLMSGYFAAQYGPELGWRLSLGIAGILVIAGAAFWWGIDAVNIHRPGFFRSPVETTAGKTSEG
jgi:MFS transporter, ACS family, D-galactonate transporter